MTAIRIERLAEGITLYLGDNREVLADIAPFDAIISDPPYGIDFNHSGQHGRFGAVGVTKAARARGNRPIEGDAEPFDPAPWIELCPNVLLWGADHFYPRLPDRGRLLAFNKLGDMEPWDSFSDVEFAWHSADAAARCFNMKWKGIACDKRGENNGLREHPTQKPIALMQWCLDQAEVEIGQMVLDPFMGAGTTGVAAAKTGRRFQGIELDEAYFDVSCRRIADTIEETRRQPDFLRSWEWGPAENG